MPENRFVGKPFLCLFRLSVSFLQFYFNVTYQVLVFLQAQYNHCAIPIFCKINRASTIYNGFDLRKLFLRSETGRICTMFKRSFHIIYFILILSEYYRKSSVFRHYIALCRLHSGLP